MYITKEQLDKRVQTSELIIKERKRKERGVEERLTPEDRATIGILSNLGTQKEVADLMGVSQTTVSNVSRGLVAPASGVNEELLEKVEEGSEEINKIKDERKAKIQDALLTNLVSALGQVSSGLHNTGATEASKIAVDMSKIMDKLSGDKDSRGNRTAIIINVPSMKEEKHYQTIEV